jgi:hypothetical protein
VILRLKSPNCAAGFKAQIRKPSTINFEVKSRETLATGFEVKLEKTVPVILRPNH